MLEVLELCRDVVLQLAPLLAWRLSGFGGTLCRGVPLAPGVAHLVLGPLARSAVQGVNHLPEVVEVRIPLADWASTASE